MIAKLCTVVCGLISAAVLGVSATDPGALLREAYKPVMENEWVRVQRVHYAPNVKLPSHAHTEFAAAYVYLNASGPVVFRHSGVDYGAATRAATKPGMFRLYRAVKEMHEVENTTSQPSDFLRIEFKTEPRETALLRGRFERVAFANGETERVQFENAMLRVTRIAVADGVAFRDEKVVYPSLFVDTHSGTVRWIGQHGSYGLQPEGQPSRDLLRFELKTPPQTHAN